MTSLTITSPVDAHVHFRDRDMMRRVVPLTAETFSAALVMPNLEKPIEDRVQAFYYADRIKRAAHRVNPDFEPLMTLYLNGRMTKTGLHEWFNPHPSIATADPVTLKAVKLYPKGMTTNSEHGIDLDSFAVERMLADLEELQIPLCVHGEAAGFVLDREKRFLERHADKWMEKFPKLRLCLEHITTADAVEFLIAHPTVHATVTPHHLLTTLDDVIGGTLNPHLFCKPIPKRELDRDMLRQVVTAPHTLSSHQQHLAQTLLLGTDSAPHPRRNKESACGCAGVFTAPFALPLVAQVFADAWTRHATDETHVRQQLQAFCSGNACRFYGLTLKRKVVELALSRYVIPEKFPGCGAGVVQVIPMWAGREIAWTVARITPEPGKPGVP